MSAPSGDGAVPTPPDDHAAADTGPDDAVIPQAADETDGADRSEITPPEVFVPVAFVEVSLTLPSTHPVLVLEEIAGPNRQLRIPIGVAEGSAIAYAARRIPTPRPLTHEFFTTLLESLGVTLETVRITSATGNSYSAEALFSSPTGSRRVKCRPSDGVCLALRQRLVPPIAVAQAVLDELGYDRDQLPN